MLVGLPEAVKHRVMREFNPRGPVSDISGRFCSFARSIATAVQAEEQHAANARGTKRPAEWAPEASLQQQPPVPQFVAPPAQQYPPGQEIYEYQHVAQPPPHGYS